MAKVDFFIIGAPKCGTTSLCEYLRQHPDVQMSTPKEPHHFCSDFSDVLRAYPTIEEYEQRAFPDQSPALLRGEASATYLYSQVAVQNIQRYNPQAKYIALLRNPIDMVISLHSQLLWDGDENVASFEQAWSLIEARRQGSQIPAHTREPQFLLYRDFANYHEQLQRLYRLVNADRVHIILFDDLKIDVQAVYKGVLSFLELPDDNRTEFPVYNSTRNSRSALFNRLLQKPPESAVAAAKIIKAKLGIKRFNALRLLKALNSTKNKEPLSVEFKEELYRQFKSDIVQLEKLLEKDLSVWSCT